MALVLVAADTKDFNDSPSTTSSEKSVDTKADKDLILTAIIPSYRTIIVGLFIRFLLSVLVVVGWCVTAM